MLINDTNMLVGENCEEYEPRYINIHSDMGAMAKSCVNCEYHSDGECTKNIFNDLAEKLSKN